MTHVEQFQGFDQANTTAVPDVFFDELLPDLSGAECKVMLYIIRRTIGFKKSTDSISFNQFQNGITTHDGRVLDKGCGVKDRTTLSKALASLEAKNCIETTKGKNAKKINEITAYSIKFRSQGSREILPPVVGKSYQGSRETPQGVVGKSYPQLDSNTTNSLTNDTYDASAPLPHVFSDGELLALLQERGYSVTNQPELSTPIVDKSSADPLATCNPIASDAPQPTHNENGSHEQPASGKKPRTPAQPLDETTKARVERVFSYFDKLKQEMTGDSEAKYVRTKTAIGEIKDTLLPCAPTEQRLRKVYMALWNTPRDARSGFEWKKNMTVKAVCGQYEARVIDIIAEEKRDAEKKREQERYMSPAAPIAPVEDDLPFDIERVRANRRRIGNRQVV